MAKQEETKDLQPAVSCGRVGRLSSHTEGNMASAALLLLFTVGSVFAQVSAERNLVYVTVVSIVYICHSALNAVAVATSTKMICAG